MLIRDEKGKAVVHLTVEPEEEGSILDAIRVAVLAERERCAKIAQGYIGGSDKSTNVHIAAAIRDENFTLQRKIK